MTYHARSLATVVLFTLASCGSRGHVAVSPTFQPSGWETVAILPFGGPTNLVEHAAQSFAIRLLGLVPYQLIQPGVISEQVTTVRWGQGQLSVSQARNVAEQVGADAVIIGTLLARNDGMTLNATVSVQLVDVATGEVVAASQRDSGRLFASGDDQTVESAAGRAAADMVSALQALRSR